MKMFILGTLTAIVIATGVGIVLSNYLTNPAYDAFSTPSARVGEDSTAEHRFGEQAN
ncbi:hypothetical protein JL100_005510 [Skermanella mucosa]|uniref:hypothetical protein n=1 Tax=Skermanella mucosa TaxID=1789672 RepID=UPI00192C444D|nr:hypothetical protein [Skermanella mucosa]UEM22209.1 hypothetical protein JL100_005510 [Skermanella mucosa]